jgi:hypothetical protein
MEVSAEGMAWTSPPGAAMPMPDVYWGLGLMALEQGALE